jgi:hypothetical protein
MTTTDKKRRKKEQQQQPEITPEMLVQKEKELSEEWERIKKTLKEKPSWMIDENSTLGEVLEFHAVTMPFKWQQLIEIGEKTAQDLCEFAKIFDDRPKEKECWLKLADGSRRHAEEMRQKTWQIRAAEAAQKELDSLR